MKKETLIIIFYVLYFGWLFSVTYLNQDPKILNYFSYVVAGFYFLFLREKGDFFWFILGNALLAVLVITSFTNFQLKIDLSGFYYTPPWLPVAWGTTFVALRKFVLILER